MSLDSDRLPSAPIERPPSLFEQIREKQPDATEREAFLLEHLVGAMGMVRRLMKEGRYLWDFESDKDAYEEFNDWLDANYGWKLRWDKAK